MYSSKSISQAFIFIIISAMAPGFASGQEKADLVFGVMADVQYCDHNSIGQTCYRTAIPKLESAVNVLNKAQPNFVIQLGDFVDRDFASFDVIMPIYDKLKMPHYHAIGNHDWATRAGADKCKVPQRFGLASPYYDFKVGMWRFVVLNSSDISTSGNAEGSEKYIEAQNLCEQFKKEGKPNGVPWGGAIAKEQLDWLKAVLKNAKDCNERAVVFAHHTLLPWTGSRLWNADEVIDILESSGCVVAYFAGHDHTGAYVCHNGINYLTIDGMVETPRKNAYAIVSAYPDRLEVKGYGRIKYRTMPIYAGNVVGIKKEK